MDRRIYIMVTALFILFACILFRTGFHVYAGEVSTEYEEENNTKSEGYDINKETDDILDRLNAESVDNELQKLQIEGSISFTKITESLMEGDFSGVIKQIKNSVITSVTNEIKINKNLMLQLMAVVMVGAVFVNLAGPFGGGMTPENGFYITYLIITSIMLSSFTLVLNVTAEAISEIISVIRVLIPIYILSLNFLGETVSSAWMYQIMLVGIWLVEIFILNVIIPMIKFYVILTMVNNINKEDSFSKMANLLKSLINWILKTMVVFIAGINVIKTMIAPAMDSVSKSAVNKVISALPGGSVVSLLTGTFISAGKLVKNSIGAAGIIILLIVVLIPVIKMVIMMIMTKFTAALVQPVGDKRYAAGIEALSEGCKLLLTALGSAVVIFMLSIALIAVSSSGG